MRKINFLSLFIVMIVSFNYTHIAEAREISAGNFNVSSDERIVTIINYDIYNEERLILKYSIEEHQKPLTIYKTDNNKYIQLLRLYIGDEYDSFQSPVFYIEKGKMYLNVRRKVGRYFGSQKFLITKDNKLKEISDKIYFRVIKSSIYPDSFDYLYPVRYTESQYRSYKDEQEERSDYFIDVGSKLINYKNKKNIIEKNNYQKAIKYFKRAISEHPSYPRAYLNLGRTYFYNGESIKAIANLEKAIEFTIGNKSIETYNYSKLDLDKKDNLMRAINCLGRIYEKEGIQNQAIYYFRILKKASQNKINNYNNQLLDKENLISDYEGLFQEINND
ncbi:MAG: tetratricopeptide repeat protein [Candidatus Woesearchaeota archaeon]